MSAFVDRRIDRIGEDAQRFFVIVKHTVTVRVIHVGVTVGTGTRQAVRRQGFLPRGRLLR